ncbi:MAG: hypothetical protein LBS19_11170 [Clostridiales bacterium]|jgi:hypothetical protein|nr:hypothetical protein [Clostridiales bacterium]
MKKGVMGHGAASIILVFTVLCLTVFAVISLTQATSDRALAQAAERMAKGYYEADTLAERVVSRLIKTGLRDGSVLNVEVTSRSEEGRTVVSFAVPVTDEKELLVEAAITESDCEVLVWKMRDINNYTG